MTDVKEESFRNSQEKYWEDINLNDCEYLLRTLEREAYTSVVNALRAKGPPSYYIFLLLEHLRRELSIDDEVGHAEIRRAVLDPKLSKISKVLNPNYDTCTEWIACEVAVRGDVEAVPCRGKPFASTGSSSMANQLLEKAGACNEKINRSTGRAFELLSHPHKPFVPERLRILLRETDRVEQRIAPPLETPSTCIAFVEKKEDASEEKAPPAKKRRNRTSKGAKSKEIPPELLPENEEKEDEEEIASSSTAVAAVSVTPLATNAANLSSSSVMGSGDSVIISPGQPPQSGDAMKTWVSKIHEQELAASAKKNGGVLSSEDTSSLPSTSTCTCDEPPLKRKRRSKNAMQDSYYLNTSARTRPWQFEAAESGMPKPPRGNPDKRSMPKTVYPETPSSVATANQTTVTTGSPSASHYSTYTTPSRNKMTDEEATATCISPKADSTLPPTSPPTYSGVGMQPMTPTSLLLLKSKKPTILPRAQHRYFVNKSGVVGGNPSNASAMRSQSNTGGIGGRTASLGSQQQLATTSGFQLATQKASSSNSSSSINSMGGGNVSCPIGSNRPMVDLDIEPASVSSLAAESGHDYGVTSTPVPVTADETADNGRFPARVMARDRWINPRLRGGRVTTPSYKATTPLPSQLRAAGGLEARRASQGLDARDTAPPTAAAATGVAVGETGERASDGTIQAIVHNIHLETAQKESANGKRSSLMPNGVLNHQSASSIQSTQPHSVRCPSTYSVAGASSSSMMSMGGVHQSLPPPMPRPYPVTTPLPSAMRALRASLSSQSTPTTVSHCSPSSSTGPFGGAAPSTSSVPIPTAVPSIAHANPEAVALITNALLALRQEGGQGILTDRFNEAIANIVVIDAPPPPPAPQQQQQQQQQPPAAPAAAPPRPSQKQYLLQPQAVPVGYAEFKPDNPMSYKSYASDGTLVEYGVSPQELYEGGSVAKAATSSSVMGGGSGSTVGGMRRQQQQLTYSPLNFPILQQAQVTAAVAAASRLGIPTSFSPSSTSRGVIHDNRPSTIRDQQQPYLQPAPLQQPPGSAAAAPKEERASSDVNDILEQSCRELR